MEKKINLEKIFEIKNPQDGKLPQWAKIFTLEVCRQVLELAAENSEFYSWDTIVELKNIEEINKQSILNTINQVE